MSLRWEWAFLLLLGLLSWLWTLWRADDQAGPTVGWVPRRRLPYGCWPGARMGQGSWALVSSQLQLPPGP